MLPLLDDLAYRVVAIRIRDKFDEVLGDLVDNPLLLARSFGQSDDYFDNAQAVLVQAEVIQLSVNLIEYEGLFFLVKALALKNFPDDMRALLIN